MSRYGKNATAAYGLWRLPMREPTAKHPTDVAVLTFVGPDARVGQARKAMRVLGFKEAEKRQADGTAIPWRESRHFKPAEQLPAMLLVGARYREGLTQTDLAEQTGIHRRHISEMENGKRPIGKTNARKLAEALNIDPRRLLTI